MWLHLTCFRCLNVAHKFAVNLAVFFSIHFSRDLRKAIERVPWGFFVLGVPSKLWDSLVVHNKIRFSQTMPLLDTENSSPVLFLNYFLGFWLVCQVWVFVFFFPFLIASLSWVRERSTWSHRGRATRTYNKQRKSCLFCLSRACCIYLHLKPAKDISEL